MNLPNFLIVGAAKSGTSSLHEYLKQHPDIFLPHIKEPMFFCDSPGRVTVNLADYAQLFRAATSYKAIGEASTPYLYDLEAPMKIKNTLGNIPIIILLRQPAERAYSLWSYFYHQQFETLSFEASLAAEAERKASIEFQKSSPVYPGYRFYFSSGLYAEQIERYISIFGKSRVHVFLFDQLKQTPDAVCRQIFQILCVDEQFTPKFAIYNEQKTSKIGWVSQLMTTHRPVTVDKIYNRLPYLLRETAFNVARFVYQLNSKPAKSEKLSPDLYRKLTEQYRPDILRLEQLLELDLSSWYQL